MNLTLTLADLILMSLVALVFGGLLGVWVRRPANAVPALPKEWAVSARAVLSAHERRLYRLLRNAFPRHLIAPKLALVRFCQPNEASKVRYWYNLLGSSHVTFAVCEPDGRVLLAVDLDGDRHRSRRSVQIRQSVLAACGIKHLRLTAQQLPDVAELRSTLPADAIGPGAPASPEQHPSPMLDAAWTTLATTVAARRAQRKPKWQESRLFQDSFFSSDGLTDVETDPPAPPSRAARPEPTARRTSNLTRPGMGKLPLTMGK